MANRNKQPSAGSKCCLVSQCIQRDRHKLCVFSSKLCLFRKIIIPTQEDIYQHKCLLIIEYGGNFRLPNKPISYETFNFSGTLRKLTPKIQSGICLLLPSRHFASLFKFVNSVSLTPGKLGTNFEILNIPLIITPITPFQLFRL